jgi:transposase
MTEVVTAAVTVGVDPHRRVFTATVLDERGRNIGHEHFENTRTGHEAVLAWAARLGPVDRVGVEGAGGLGRPLAQFLVQAGIDVRDVPPHKTSLRGRGRHEGKSDRLDSHRVAAETQSNDRLAHAFKQSQPLPPDQVRDRIALWHNARISLRKIRVQLIGEIDAMIQQLPEDLRTQLPVTQTVRARITALGKVDTGMIVDPLDLLRLDLLQHRVGMLREVLTQDKTAADELGRLVTHAKSTLPTVPGVAARAAAEILLETGDVRRFTEAGFARYNGTAPIPATSGEAGGQPVRHRLNRGGNRRLNAVIHRIAMIQLRCQPSARQLYERVIAAGHTRREAMRVLKRHLSNVIYRTLLRDLREAPLLT